MPRLFSSDCIFMRQHLFKHISVSHTGFFKLNILLLQRFFQSHITHYCPYNSIAR